MAFLHVAQKRVIFFTAISLSFCQNQAQATANGVASASSDTGGHQHLPQVGHCLQWSIAACIFCGVFPSSHLVCLGISRVPSQLAVTTGKALSGCNFPVQPFQSLDVVFFPFFPGVGPCFLFAQSCSVRSLLHGQARGAWCLAFFSRLGR